MNFAECYERAAEALSKAIQQDAAAHEKAGDYGWRALLDPYDFHERCMAIAERMQITPWDEAVLGDLDELMGGTGPPSP